ncbi:MAG: Low affinity potassium transport system protein kup, partial [Pseudomonadota bacterium]
MGRISVTQPDFCQAVLFVSSTKSSLAALTLGAIGVVYGDIGTSVLYAMKEVFGSGHVPFTHDNVYGILSIFFWTLTTIVSVKYVVLVLRADNHGEGGLVAMLALASQSVKDKPQLRKVLLIVGIFGTCLFYGDGVITPAISVLSAVEGLEVISPTFKKYVIPLTLVILFGLFWVQKRGTAGIGKFFGPITLIWFATIAVLGVSHIVHHPEILLAISPHYALGFVWANPGTTFIILGAVVLCVTGGEALYADLGHFGKKPIRLAWFSVVMPCLTLNYFGQGALLLAEPEAVKNPFFMMAPDWALVPLVGLATMATVIASQALITGAFSVTKQVIQLGYLPRLQVLHTSETDTGQIYMPFVNWGLFVAIVLAVILFKSSSNLAAAYGIAVCTDMLITTVLTFFVIRYSWKLPLALCIGATGFFFVVDLAFWASNMFKLFDGGWFPLLIGTAVFTLMLTWHDGRRLLNDSLRSDALRLADFMESVFISPPTRVAGTA